MMLLTLMKKKILIVEDEKPLRSLYEEELSLGLVEERRTERR